MVHGSAITKQKHDADKNPEVCSQAGVLAAVLNLRGDRQADGVGPDFVVAAGVVGCAHGCVGG